MRAKKVKREAPEVYEKVIKENSGWNKGKKPRGYAIKEEIINQLDFDFNQYHYDYEEK